MNKKWNLISWVIMYAICIIGSLFFCYTITGPFHLIFCAMLGGICGWNRQNLENYLHMKFEKNNKET